MIRKFNYTGRKRIPRSRVTIRLLPTEDRAPSFQADFDLSGLDLPEDGSVFLEAYDRSSYMRFAFGTVAHPQPPENRCLKDLQSRDLIYFRLKVVDTTGHGKVLAIADQLPCARLPGHNSIKQSILGVRFNYLGEQIWRMEFTEDLPILELNEELASAGLRDMVRSDDLFISLVYPAVVRQIFAKIVLGDEDLDPASEDWRGLWLRYAASIGAELEGSHERSELEAWIDEEVVPAFCRRFRIRELFLASKTGDESQ